MSSKRTPRQNIWWQENAATHPLYGLGPSKAARRKELGVSNRSYIIGEQFVTQKIFENTAIAAQIPNSQFEGGPQPFYVDQLIKCKDCTRYFVYFAREHQQQVEENGKSIHAIPNHCYDCRSLYQRSKLAKIEFERLLSELKAADRSGNPGQSLSNDQWVELAEHLLMLLNDGQIEMSESTRQLLSRIQKLSADHLPNLTGVNARLMAVVEKSQKHFPF